jgi:hypothetical protein
MFSMANQEIDMKRNAIGSKSVSATLVVKVVSLAIAAVLSGCAVTGPLSSDELTAEMSFNDFHYGP